MATVLGLGRLDSDSVRELVTRALGDAADVPGSLVSRLGGETEGLPLFLSEYLAAVAGGELDVGEDSWALPGGVQDLLKGRLRTVGETAGQVLAAAAVVGRSFDFDTVREASGRGEEETLASLEELASRGLIREVPDAPSGGPTYDFDHDKLRTLVYEETGLARRRLLHRRAAAALAGRARGREIGPIAGQVARHHGLAGQDAEAAEYHRLAGDHARGLYANDDALAHYEEAIALGHPDAAALHEAVGDLRTRRGEYGAALASYELAAASGGTETVAALEHKIGTVHARRGERDLARSHYESALAALEEATAPPASSPGCSSTGACSRTSETSRGRRGSSPTGRWRWPARPTTRGPWPRRTTCSASWPARRATGRRPSAISGRASTSRRGSGTPSPRWRPSTTSPSPSGPRGETEEALKTAGTALELCARLGDRHREAALRNNLADLCHAAGREEESMAHLKRAVEIFAEIGEGDRLQPEIWKLVEW